MKIVMLSKALVSGAYQKKLEELARLPGVELLALVPPAWREPGAGIIRLERSFTEGYRLETLPMVLNGQHHLHFYPGLRSVLERERPDVFHIDEEAFNLATFQAMRAGVAVEARCCFYNWANMERNYPPPFGWFEQYTFRHAAHAIVGNQEAADIIRRHGYRGAITLLPQFGVDPDLFAPPAETQPRSAQAPFIIGYLGRLVAAKGVFDLLEALAGLPEQARLLLVGSGDLRPQIEQRARELHIQERVTIRGAVPSTDVPEVLRGLDALVLPSHTMPNWKEQFGRILVEAMSCGVPVVGSSSGEIANVIGGAGLVFPERNIAALRNALRLLLDDAGLRRALGRRGRERVLAHYTQAALARGYYEVYRAMVG
jgi:glycosyltransferase involved in cell wall biosynthesis